MWAGKLLIEVYAHLGFQLWAPRPLIAVRARLGFQVWVPSPLIWVCVNLASGVCWGCLSGVQSTGAEGVGVQEAKVVEESSLNSL